MKKLKPVPFDTFLKVRFGKRKLITHKFITHSSEL